ncbi:MAG: hypothetical protein LQ342_003717 [Letrouitia transgressa]|nr:MAG: hypothetical protein LQ342_003717 [Letrouitia transgressa]
MFCSSLLCAQWLLPFLAVHFDCLVKAWSLADDCTGANAAKIQEAMPNAIAMADYASKRAIQDSSYQRKGTLLQDLFGASSEDDANALSLARQWFGAARDVASANTAPDSGLIIHCTDNYLTTIDAATGVYRDNTRGSVRVQVARRQGYTNNACGGQLRAFEYSFSGGNVIVLCSDWEGGALPASTDNSIEGWRTLGNLKSASESTGINIFERYLSYKILHELMHAANDRQFPAALPDGNIGEL